MTDEFLFLTELDEDTSPDLTDIIYVVKDPNGTPVDRKVTFQTFRNLVSPAGRASTVMSGTLTLQDTDVEYQFVDPDGEDRDIVLPAEGENNHTFFIVHVGDGDETITVKNDGGDVLAKIYQGFAKTFISDESDWTWIGAKTEILDIPAGAFKELSTNGCAAIATQEMSTNKQVLRYLAFDASSDESAEVKVDMPKWWDGGTIRCHVVWTHPAAASYGVNWSISGRAYEDGDALDQALGTAQAVADSGGTTYDRYLTDKTAPITLAGSPAGGQTIILRVTRDVSEDDLNVDAWLLGLVVEYGVF